MPRSGNGPGVFQTAALCVWLAAGATALPAPPGTDLHGEALPAGAVARFGTTRLRALCDSLHFSKDGKTLLGVNGGRTVRIWDAADGKLLATRQLAGRSARPLWGMRTSCSADGRTLLIAEGASLEMWDLPSGKRLDVPLPRGRKRFDCLALSNDRRLLLLGETVSERHSRATADTVVTHEMMPIFLAREGISPPTTAGPRIISSSFPSAVSLPGTPCLPPRTFPSGQPPCGTLERFLWPSKSCEAA